MDVVGSVNEPLSQIGPSCVNVVFEVITLKNISSKKINIFNKIYHVN